MVQRRIVEIDEEKCDGCGLCIPACHEGAIEIVEGKARLHDDKFCDGIGDCLGECPQDAIKIIERDAGEYDEIAVQKRMDQLATENNHRLSSEENNSNQGGCPGLKMMDFRIEEDESEDELDKADIKEIANIDINLAKKDDNKGVKKNTVDTGDIEISIKSQLQQWPVQLMLVPENAPYFDGAELLLTADCVPLAYPDYHLDLLKGKAVAMGCPKLDDNNYYTEKLKSIVNQNDIKGITVAFMEVPCCTGLVRAAEKAVQESGKDICISKVKIGIKGNKELI